MSAELFFTCQSLSGQRPAIWPEHTDGICLLMSHLLPCFHNVKYLYTYFVDHVQAIHYTIHTLSLCCHSGTKIDLFSFWNQMLSFCDQKSAMCNLSERYKDAHCTRCQVLFVHLSLLSCYLLLQSFHVTSRHPPAQNYHPVTLVPSNHRTPITLHPYIHACSNYKCILV